MCNNVICKFCPKYNECDELFLYNVYFNAHKNSYHCMTVKSSIKGIEELSLLNPDLTFKLYIPED